MSNIGFWIDACGLIARLCLCVAFLLFLVGRLQGMKSKDKVADYIQECIEDPNINVYYDDNMHLTIEHLPNSEFTTNSEEKKDG